MPVYIMEFLVSSFYAFVLKTGVAGLNKLNSEPDATFCENIILTRIKSIQTEKITSEKLLIFYY